MIVKVKLEDPLGYVFGASLKPNEMTTNDGPEASEATKSPPFPDVQDEAPAFHAVAEGGQTTEVGAERFTSPVTVFPEVPDAAIAPAVPEGTGSN